MEQGIIEDAKPDTYVHVDRFLSEYRPELVTDWLRTEHLVDDFLSLAWQVYGEALTVEKISEIRDVMKNKAPTYCEYEWTEEAMAALYRACPLWASYEQQVYGDLLVKI
jgi:hypothetical protein